MIASLLSRALSFPPLERLCRGLCARSTLFRRLVWNRLALDAELRFQQDEGNRWRASPEFMEQTGALFEQWDLLATDHSGRIVVDLGAGPRLRSAWFEGARIHAVEPLAEQYRNLECCDYEKAEAVYSDPAERVVETLRGRASLVICLNVLDHVYDPLAVVRAAAQYLSPEGRFLLSTDLHDADPPGHPVALDEAVVTGWCRQAGLEIVWTRTGLGAIGPGYGGEEGESAITLLLRRA